MLLLEFTVQKITFGVLISAFCIWITEVFILKRSLIDIFPMHLFNLIHYFFVLMYEIFKSALRGVKSLYTGKLDFGFITIKTELKDDYSRTILANSITLLPGTITINKEDDELLVLWMEPSTDDAKEAGDIIKKRLEVVLKEG